MNTRAVALLIVVVASGVRAQQIFVNNAPPPPPETNLGPPGSIGGHVLNAITGEPVRGAMVTLQNLARGGNFQPATTDSAGAFSVGSLPPGEYFAQVNHAGYPGILGISNASQNVTVGPGEAASGVTLRLMPGGSISGKVVDDGDEPVSGCPIWALGQGQGPNQGPYTPRGNATTNDKGEYKFENLTADRYVLYARCQDSLPVERPLAVWHPEQVEPAESWLPVYYPDSSTPESAQRLTVFPGRDVQGVDFRLRPTAVSTVTGTIAGAVSGPTDGQPNVFLIPAGAGLDTSFAYGGSFDRTNSTFRIPMVPPGSYRLVAVHYLGQMDSIAYAVVPVTVGNVRPAPLSVQLRPGITLSGSVEQPPSADGAAPGRTVVFNSLRGPGQQPPKEPPRGYVQMMPLAPAVFSNFHQAEVHQDGTFQVQGLTPGRYQLAVQMIGQRPLTVESVQYGASQVEHGVLDVADGASGAIRVRMTSGAPQVRVSLADAPGASRSTWAVLALPVDEPLVWQFQQSMGGAGKSGETVPLANPRVGKFAFAAVEMAVGGIFQDGRLIRLLRDQLEPVDIVAGQDQTVSPRFFTGADLEKLALGYLQGETP